MADTLCWSCKRALCGCSWSKYFIPVKGWKAKKTKINCGPQGYTDSYKVIACPEYLKDNPQVVKGQAVQRQRYATVSVKSKCRAILVNADLTQRELAKRLGVSSSTIWKAANGRFLTKSVADKIEQAYNEMLKEENGHAVIQSKTKA